MCEPGTSAFPTWTTRTGTLSVGTCKKVPTVLSAEAPVAGQLMAVTGADFEASDELKCALLSGSGGSIIMKTLFVSATLIECLVPSEAAGGTYELSVANYGAAYYSATNVGASYAAVSVSVPSTSPPSPPPASVGLIAGLGVCAALFVLTLICLLLVVMQEKSGKPMFVSKVIPAA